MQRLVKIRMKLNQMKSKFLRKLICVWTKTGNLLTFLFCIYLFVVCTFLLCLTVTECSKKRSD